MPPWTFKRYVTYRKERPFEDWLVAQPQAVRNALRDALLILRADRDWYAKKCSYYKPLDSPHEPLGEVIFEVKEPHTGKRVQYRALGVRQESERSFIFFGGLRKRGRDVIPITAFDDARRQYEHYSNGLGSLDRHDIV